MEVDPPSVAVVVIDEDMSVVEVGIPVVVWSGSRKGDTVASALMMGRTSATRQRNL